VLRKGRFSDDIDTKCAAFMSSMDIDRRLFLADIRLNKAHVTMLSKKNIITQEEASKIDKALTQIEKDGIESLNLDPTLEDIHMAIEKRVTELAGDCGMKIHTAKSRNDQVATDLRIVLRDEVSTIIDYLEKIQKTILTRTKEHIETLMPGYTHLQQAQVTTLAHHLLAYHSSFSRDILRLNDALKRINISPLGSGAFATTSFDIDRKMTARELGFDDIIENSMDAVSTRDFILEATSCISILAIDLSKMVQDFILWSSTEFGYLNLPDDLASTSSIMPQKKNPDLLELIRAKIGSILGYNGAVFTIASNLPQSYNRDLQQISYHLWQIVDLVKDILTLLADFLAKCEFNSDAMQKQIDGGYFFATDLADYLVKKFNYPFRKAHELVRGLIQYLDKNNKKVELDTIKNYLNENSIEISLEDLKKILDPFYSVSSKNIIGGPSKERILEYLKRNK